MWIMRMWIMRMWIMRMMRVVAMWIVRVMGVMVVRGMRVVRVLSSRFEGGLSSVLLRAIVVWRIQRALSATRAGGDQRRA